MKKSLLLFVLLLIAVAAWLCGDRLEAPKKPVLKNPPAPFAPQELVKATPELREITAINLYGRGRIANGQRYSYICGDKTLHAEPGDQAAIFKVSANGLDVLSLAYWGSTEASFGHPFNNTVPDLKIDEAGKTVTCVRKFQALAPDDSTFTLKTQQTPEGAIEMVYDAQLAPGGKTTGNGLFVSSSRFEYYAGTKVKIGDKELKFSSEEEPLGTKTLFQGDFSGVITFFADRPDKAFSIEVPEKSEMVFREIRPEGGKEKFGFTLRIQPPRKTETLKIKVDLGKTSADSLKTADEFAGINFWKLDRIHIPAFGASRNHLPNPSFESGLRYWRDFGWGRYPGEDRDVYTIDDKVAYAGKRSLRIKAWKDNPSSGVLSTLAIPVKAGTEYTISYYAKADAPDLYQHMRIIGSSWGDFPKWPPAQRLTNEWKRYSYTVKSADHVIAFMFEIANRGKTDVANAWIDAIQVEEGTTANAYVEPPVAVALESSKEGNFLKPGEPFNAKLRLQAAPNMKGTLQCEVIDFFYAKPYAARFEFTTDANGAAMIALPLEEKIGKGAFVVKSDVKLANGASWTEFQRLTVMNPAPVTAPQKSIFGALLNLTTRSHYQAQRMSDIGIGSSCYENTKILDDICTKYGFPNTGSGVVDYGPGHKGYELSDDNVKFREEVCKRVIAEPYSDALRDDVKKLSYEMAKAYPWVRTWFIQAESSVNKIGALRNNDNDGFAKLILATRAGVLKADPTLKNQPEGGPSNMSPTAGTAMYDKYLESLGKIAPEVRFDALAIHPYRPIPENPDLDADADTFLKMAERHGYKTEPVYWNEGSYYCPWVVPEWDINLGFCDRYRCGYFSYDMGWAERVSAAWNARSWLVALKYSDRVRQLISWGYHGFAFMDANATVSALGKTTNTLCNLFGDAKFKKDIRFAVNCRAYVFEDGQGRPIAALWSHIPDVDRGLEPSPLAKMRFEGLNLEFIDLMENSVAPAVDAKGLREIPVTPFPLFIRGKAGSMDALCKAIATATMVGSKEFPLAVDMKLKSRTAAALTFENRLNKAFEGEAISGALKMPLSIAETSSKTFDVALPSALPFDRIERVSLPLKVTEKEGESIDKDFSLYALAVGKNSAWDAVPWIKLTNRTGFPVNTVQAKMGYEGDFEVEYKMRWGDDKLCLLVKVIDEKTAFPKGKNEGGDWNYDSLQIYIDTYGDNANRKSKAIFDFNDYCYCISRDAETGAARVWREAAPAAQIGEAQADAFAHTEAKNIPVRVTPTENGYIYEIELPKTAISPLQLKNGSFGRLGIMVNDNDGEGRKGGLVNTPAPRSSPFANPDQWPGILLVE